MSTQPASTLTSRAPERLNNGGFPMFSFESEKRKQLLSVVLWGYNMRVQIILEVGQSIANLAWFVEFISK